MRRRDFLALAGGAASWPLAVRAQVPGRAYRVAFLTPQPRSSPPMAATFDELRLNGFIEGQNLEILPGFGLTIEQLVQRAPEVVREAPDVIAAGPALPLQALKKATSTIPLVGLSEDLVAEGLVPSMAHPDGNLTGISLLSPELDGKRQDILIEAIPGAKHIAVMADARATRPEHVQALQREAQSRGVAFSVFSVNGLAELASAIDAAKQSGAAALNFLATPLFSIPGSDTNKIVIERLAAVRLPSIFQWPETADAGAVLAYGPSFFDVNRLRGRFVARILRGAKPADMPVEQPTNFQLVANLKTAKAFGLELPETLVLRADRVIE
jgi:ABC-type uncharacterized transport system substrate-binding protein